MRIFVTGATGFIGSRITTELVERGHDVIGLTRSQAGARWLREAGAEPFHGTLEEPEALARGAERADAVIHTAFDHDFSRFIENCEKDRRVIAAIGSVLAGSDRPFLITSGTGLGSAEPGEPAREDVVDFNHPNPRRASEEAGVEAAKNGASIAVVRLPQVHDTERQGLIAPYIGFAREKGFCAWLGEGTNRWPAVHVDDAAHLYCLAVERHEAGARYHAVAEEGLPMRHVAEVIAAGLDIPARSISPDEAADYFGWLAPFAGMDMPAASAWTRDRLGWQPSGPGLIDDLRAMDYRAAGGSH